MGHKAVSHGRFFKNNTRKYFFLPGTCFHVFYTRSRTELGSLFSEYLRSFGERYLDPFFFSPGASSEFFTVLPLSENKIRRRFPAIYRRFIRKWGLRFEQIASETDFEETGVCRQIFEMIALRNGKRCWMPLPKRLVGLQEKRPGLARFPGQTRLRRC